MAKFITGHEIKSTLCVWPACLVEDTQYGEFVDFLKNTVCGGAEDIEFIPITSLTSNDHTPDGDFRVDFFFEVRGNINPFIFPRMQLGVKWYEDFVTNNPRVTYQVDEETVSVRDLTEGYPYPEDDSYEDEGHPEDDMHDDEDELDDEVYY